MAAPATEARLDAVLIEPPRPDSSAQPRGSFGPAPAEKDGAQISYRAMRPGDMDCIRSAHADMFPVDYEEAFFTRVVNYQDGLESLAAVHRESDDSEQMAGFITARGFYLHECDPVDRALLGLQHKLLDHEKVMYILTLGVLDKFRQKRVASALIQWVLQRARESRCRAVYLHVIDYNAAAIALYRRNGFAEVACREKFYCIWSGRQLDPTRQVYDAYLYAYMIDATIDQSMWSYLILAFAPLRSLMATLAACLPWAERRGSYFGGGELPPLKAEKLSPRSLQAGSKATSWLLTLFARKGTNYRK